MDKWKDIPGFEGLYQVSDSGMVRSMRFGPATKLRAEPKILKQHIGNRGYWRVNLKGRLRYTHRLILLAFCGPAPDGHEAAHLDGGRLNCNISNLAWVTRKENHSHKRLHGTVQWGEANSNSKLNETKVREILKRAANGERQCDLAKKFGITPTTIYGIVRGRSWKHISQQELDRRGK